MSLRSILSVVFLSVAVVSCSTTEEVVCDPGKLAVMATGFSDAELDSAIVIRYYAGSSFGNVADTSAARVSHESGDTVQLWVVPRAAMRTPVAFPNGYLEYGADYRLYVPKLNKWYEFSDIKLAGNTTQSIRHRKGDLKYYSCTNHIVGCKVNGAQAYVQAGGTQDAVYLTK